MRALVIAVALLGCGNRARSAPERVAPRTSLNLGATAANPEVHVNPTGDAGATQVQIGNVNVRLPGEGERGTQATPPGE